MSDTPKLRTGSNASGKAKTTANPKRTTAAKKAQDPAKKTAPRKRATKKDVAAVVDETLVLVDENKRTVRKVAKAVDKNLTDAQVDERVSAVKRWWLQVKKYLGL